MDPKTNFFKLSYADYDTYESFIFYHENKTHEEFKQDVDSLLVKYGPQLILENLTKLKKEGYNNYISVSTWIEYIIDKLPQLGYIRILPQCYNFSEELLVHDPTKFAFERTIGKKLLTKVINYNKKVSEALDDKNGLHKDDA